MSKKHKLKNRKTKVPNLKMYSTDSDAVGYRMVAEDSETILAAEMAKVQAEAAEKD
jgi:hypothetical protein